MTDQNLQRLTKVKAAIAKLGTPVTAADKAKLLQMANALTVDIQKAVPMAKVWQKDRDAINAAQKKVDEAKAKMDKYQGALVVLQKKINTSADAAYKKAKELDDAAKKPPSGKAIKEFEEIVQLLWNTQQDYASFIMWVNEA